MRHIFSAFCHETLSSHVKNNVAILERVMGIEPTYQAWEAGVLPLNYTRMASHFVLLKNIKSALYTGSS